MLSEEQIIALYSSARLFVCPSRYEPFGIINLEAMACGAPVVASATGGIKEVINSGVNGLLVPPGDVTALADAIEHLLTDEQLRLKFIEAGRRRVEQEFSWHRIAQKTYQLYEELAGK
jgi:starch synthase